MKITFSISDELAKTLEEVCLETYPGSGFRPILPSEFARECLESELASRRLPPTDGNAYERRFSS